MLGKIKDTKNKVVFFAKTKPIIFGLICFSILAVIIIIIAISVSLSKSSSQDEANNVSKDAKDGGKDDDTIDNIYSDEYLYSRMIEKKSEYPEGMGWTNSNCYSWKGGIYNSGCGCAGFAFMLSDVCFGNIKATKLTTCPTNFKVGDVVRINSDTHYVIILKIDLSTNLITVAEGNYNRSIHWGRTFTITQLKGTCNYVLRRNPISNYFLLF